MIKAQIDLQQRQRDLKDAQLGIEKAKIALGVLIFPDFSADFAVVDDLQQPALLPPVAEAQAQAAAIESRSARPRNASVEQAGYEVNVARYAVSAVARRSIFSMASTRISSRREPTDAQATGRSTLPNYRGAIAAESWLCRRRRR